VQEGRPTASKTVPSSVDQGTTIVTPAKKAKQADPITLSEAEEFFKNLYISTDRRISHTTRVTPKLLKFSKRYTDKTYNSFTEHLAPAKDFVQRVTRRAL
jgi:hypothetical protein